MMSDPSMHCIDCKAPLQPDAPAGLCPQCLLESALGPAELPTEAILATSAENSLNAPTLKLAPQHDVAQTTQIIGRYKLLQELGEGGFGIVYFAQQNEPVKRRVALKIIKPGMDSREVIARFEAERQALALMDHPNIAQVFDGGTTDSGRPYFVMELVKGVPLTQYCDDARLGMRQRLELFLDVLSAVQHAHQKGIIHRDLKPSNILVSPQDGRPVVKVIDFGIAKALNIELTEKTLFTGHGRLIGTPEYMSPEQAEINALDVDTRSDLYSLGVVLYELMTGRTPLDPKRMRQAGYDEIQRMIREEEPPRPSTRLSTLGDSLSTVASRRGTEPGKLTRQLRGELDWVVMKALEKERDRRYGTANAFAEDIKHHLTDEPVSASPPSRLYRLRKLAKRNKGAIVAACIVMITSALGTGVSLWQAREAIKARNAAAIAQQIALTEKMHVQKLLEDVRRESAISRAVNEFLNNDLFGAASPEKESDRNLPVRTVLDRATKKLEGRFEDQPLVEAAIRFTLGNTYLSLGEFRKAHEHLATSLKLRQGVLGDEHRDTLASRMLAASALQGEGLSAEAEKEHRAVLAIQERVFGTNEPSALNTRNNIANTLSSQGRQAEALIVLRELVSAKQRVLGTEHPDTLASRNNLALALQEQGNFSEAEAEHRALLEIQNRIYGPEHPATLTNRGNIGLALIRQRKFAQAEKELRDVLALDERILGPDHPSTLRTRHNLANALRGQNKYSEAENEHREVLTKRIRILGANHPDTLKSHNSHAAILSELGFLAEAEDEYRLVVKGRQEVLGKEHPDTLTALSNLAFLLGKRGKLTESEHEYRRLLAIVSSKFGPEHAEALKYRSRIAYALDLQHKFGEAEKEYCDILPIMDRVVGTNHAETLATRSNLAKVWLSIGRSADAEVEYRTLLPVMEKALGPLDHDTIVTLGNLALSLATQGKNIDALQPARDAWERWCRLYGQEHPETRQAEALYQHIMREQ